MLHSLLSLLARSPLRWHAVLGTACVLALAVELFGLHLLNTTEFRLADVLMRRHAEQYPADPGIVIVDIDDASMAAMQEIAGLWAWPREIHADLLEGLAEFKPRAVVFDIAFSEPDLKRPKSDARLSEALQAGTPAYLAALALPLSPNAARVPLRTLKEAFGQPASGPGDAVAVLSLPHAVAPAVWKLGLINSIEDDDGVLRRYRLYSDIGGWKLPSLPARVAADAGVTLPEGSDFVMRWPQQGHRRFSYGELYRLLTEQRDRLGAADVATLDALFRDKIVVIGASAAGSFDHHLTPLRAGYPGVDVLATAIDNLKNHSEMRVAHAAWPFGFGALLIVLLATGFARRINPAVLGTGLGMFSVAGLAAADAAFARNILLPVATPLAFAWAWFLFAAIAGYLRERRAREQAVSLFGRFLNPNVVRQIVEQGETVESLSGRTRQVTVLFSDIRGFTTLSENRPPHEVVTLLNRYFERQVEVVFRHGGTLDKFIGDCIMAFWGAPLDDPEHARHAVQAALEMQQVLLDFRDELIAEGSSVGDFDVGIGVHTGPAVVGFIGAQRKLDYTAIGDTVNLASRVEGLTKGVARILVTEDTVAAIQKTEGLEFKHHGAFAVKGRIAEVNLYEPKGRTA